MRCGKGKGRREKKEESLKRGTSDKLGNPAGPKNQHLGGKKGGRVPRQGEPRPCNPGGCLDISRNRGEFVEGGNYRCGRASTRGDCDSHLIITGGGGVSCFHWVWWGIPYFVQFLRKNGFYTSVDLLFEVILFPKKRPSLKNLLHAISKKQKTTKQGVFRERGRVLSGRGNIFVVVFTICCQKNAQVGLPLFVAGRGKIHPIGGAVIWMKCGSAVGEAGVKLFEFSSIMGDFRERDEGGGSPRSAREGPRHEQLKTIFGKPGRGGKRRWPEKKGREYFTGELRFRTKAWRKREATSLRRKMRGHLLRRRASSALQLSGRYPGGGVGESAEEKKGVSVHGFGEKDLRQKVSRE